MRAHGLFCCVVLMFFLGERGGEVGGWRVGGVRFRVSTVGVRVQSVLVHCSLGVTV